MKSIAVYGDSFADDIGVHCGCSKWNNFEVGPSYMELLENDGYEVVRYGVEGSSLQYSIKKFEETHKLHDKILFVSTEPGRFEYEKYNANFYGESAAVLLRRSYKNTLSDQDEKFLDLLSNFYYKKLWKNDQQQYVHKILLERVNIIRPDALVIYGIVPSYNENAFALNKVSNTEMEYWNTHQRFGFSNFLDLFNNVVYSDMRKCHLTAPNHKLLYLELKKWIDSGVINLESVKWEIPDKDVDSYRKKYT